MDREYAVFLLKCHAFAHDDLEHPKMQRGFLGMLRPFNGELVEENFHELMQIIEMLADDLGKPALDREIIACFWSICQLARAWAVYPEGMLRRNGLLTPDQEETIEEWIDMISYAVMVLLEGEGQLEEALWGYREYIKRT